MVTFDEKVREQYIDSLVRYRYWERIYECLMEEYYDEEQYEEERRTTLIHYDDSDTESDALYVKIAKSIGAMNEDGGFVDASKPEGLAMRQFYLDCWKAAGIRAEQSFAIWKMRFEAKHDGPVLFLSVEVA